jgi:hydroxymethyl cephem carbamoyltransferase
VLLVGFKPGHDGSVTVVKDRKLLYSLEGEKDSFPRHSFQTPSNLLDMAELLGELPDVVALGGWDKQYSGLGCPDIATGYSGTAVREHRTSSFFGKPVTFFSSSHERSHLLMSVGTAPRDDAQERAILIWEGAIGAFHLLDERFEVKDSVKVMELPGFRYSFLYGLADPTFPGAPQWPRDEDAGKLMALAAFADAGDADEAIAATVESIMEAPTVLPAPKAEFRDSPVYNAGVEAEETKIAAALLTKRIFDLFAAAAQERLPSGIPLHISGGCGLNCDWNRQWRDMGHFSSVFVPPCTNDAGSALGTVIDALAAFTGDPYIDWSVYCGLEFEWDTEPDPSVWQRRALDTGQVSGALTRGEVVAWVQGRWEMGPRALGNRSLLAEPFDPRTRDRLNEIKQREGFRPIAPVCRVEDLAKAFDTTFEDPYMLYFRRVHSPDLGAVTHVDGSARCQTVTPHDNGPLHELLSAFAAEAGIGVLCNTSLNFKGLGFINRMTDLDKYCESRGVEHMVVGDLWFERKRSPAELREGAAALATQS